MQSSNTQLLVERAMRGEDVSLIVDSIVKRKPQNTVKPSKTYLLGYLRPNDRFTFLEQSREDDFYNVECMVVPAERGFVAFATPDGGALTMSLEESLSYSVLLCSDSSSVSERRFYVGDKVKNRITQESGTVFKSHKHGLYTVSTEKGQLVEVNGSALFLIDKDETTKNYIVKKDDLWIVSFGPHISEHQSQLDAVKTLYKSNRSAFNRYSKLLSVDASIPVDDRTTRYLLRTDPKIWRNLNVLSNRGLTEDGKSLDEVANDLLKEQGD